mmetsp:Transcript_110872/g.292824  ORF Transcript_110872/g.292824 Transcript_110872/m.292824 type:complete len:755 (-) Transcript_110872:35-2299(-)
MDGGLHQLSAGAAARGGVLVLPRQHAGAPLLGDCDVAGVEGARDGERGPGGRSRRGSGGRHGLRHRTPDNLHRMQPRRRHGDARPPRHGAALVRRPGGGGAPHLAVLGRAGDVRQEPGGFAARGARDAGRRLGADGARALQGGEDGDGKAEQVHPGLHHRRRRLLRLPRHPRLAVRGHRDQGQGDLHAHAARQNLRWGAHHRPRLDGRPSRYVWSDAPGDDQHPPRDRDSEPDAAGPRHGHLQLRGRAPRERLHAAGGLRPRAAPGADLRGRRRLVLVQRWACPGSRHSLHRLGRALARGRQAHERLRDPAELPGPAGVRHGLVPGDGRDAEHLAGLPARLRGGQGRQRVRRLGGARRQLQLRLRQLLAEVRAARERVRIHCRDGPLSHRHQHRQRGGPAPGVPRRLPVQGELEADGRVDGGRAQPRQLHGEHSEPEARVRHVVRQEGGWLPWVLPDHEPDPAHALRAHRRRQALRRRVPGPHEQAVHGLRPRHRRRPGRQLLLRARRARQRPSGAAPPRRHRRRARPRHAGHAGPDAGPRPRDGPRERGRLLQLQRRLHHPRPGLRGRREVAHLHVAHEHGPVAGGCVPGAGAEPRQQPAHPGCQPPRLQELLPGGHPAQVRLLPQPDGRARPGEERHRHDLAAGVRLHHAGGLCDVRDVRPPGHQDEEEQGRRPHGGGDRHREHIEHFLSRGGISALFSLALLLLVPAPCSIPLPPPLPPASPPSLGFSPVGLGASVRVPRRAPRGGLREAA